VEDIRNFTWHVFCDAYVEAVKDRLYRHEVHGEAAKVAAQQTLYEVLYRLLQLLAPVTPHLTEEIYQTMYAEHKRYKSLQASPWPEFQQSLVDEEAETRGDLIVMLISEIRREKAEKHLPLNAPVKKLTVYAGGNIGTANVIQSARGDITGTCKIVHIEVLLEKRKSPRKGRIIGKEVVQDTREIAQFPGVRFVAEYEEEMKK
jgi:valyl-tRNA synthetase